MNVYRKAFAEHLEWLVTMAMTPGWWQHSRLRARERLKAAGFRPAKEEMKEIES